MVWYMIYLSTAIGLTHRGSSTVHIYIETINRTNQATLNSTNNIRTTQTATNFEECGPCPVLTSFTLAFTLQLTEKHRKTSFRVAEEFYYTYYQHTCTHTHPHMAISTHTHTLQNNLKLPQYKLKQTLYKIHPNEIVTALSSTFSTRSPECTKHFYP